MDRRPSALIRPAEAGQSLDAWVTARFTYHLLDEWRDLIRRKRVLVNGGASTPDYLLAAGDKVEYHPFDVVEPPVLTNFTVLHEDDDLLVVNKPPDLPCHPAGIYFKHTLWYLLHQQHPDIRFVNRLDRETSGVVLVAKNRPAARLLGKQQEGGGMTKEYLALVEGEFPPTLTADGVLVADPTSAVYKKRRFQPAGDGEACHTEFAGVGHGGGLSLVRCRPDTGRLHQLRAVLWSLGFPLVGDKVYGVDESIFVRFIGDGLTDHDVTVLRLPHQALHAWTLSFTDTQGVAQKLTAPLPPTFAALLARVGIPGPV